LRIVYRNHKENIVRQEGGGEIRKKCPLKRSSGRKKRPNDGCGTTESQKVSTPSGGREGRFQKKKEDDLRKKTKRGGRYNGEEGKTCKFQRAP